MEEDFLSYLWTYKLIGKELIGVLQEEIRIEHPGERNPDAGPDFLNARIRINDTLWAGNVELHVRASDWFRHGHQNDEAYRSVILHVVYEDDLKSDPDRLPIPKLEVKGKFESHILTQYRSFLSSRRWVACAPLLRELDHFTIANWLESLAVERLIQKSSRLNERLEASAYQWEQTFFEQLARSFGARVNADAFERLARSIPLRVLAREKLQPLNIEAILFGQAGMLDEKVPDPYQKELLQIYKALKKKHKLHSPKAKGFRFLRLRPQNFPTIRIAQFSSLICSSQNLLLKCLDARSPEELIALFRNRASDYWTCHYRFGKKTSIHSSNMGDESLNLILVNTVIPFIFSYADHYQQHIMKERALIILDRLSPEENHIIKNWRMHGLAVANALGTQALLELKSKYCDQKRCLQCRFGHQFIGGLQSTAESS